MTALPQPDRFAPTLQDVLDRLAAAELPPTRRRDLASAVRRVAEVLQKPPAQISAQVRTLSQALAANSPAAHGMSPKTWSNLRSNLLAALRAAEVKTIANTARTPLAPEWRVPPLAPALEKRLRNGLSRFMHFCSAAAIAPEAVDDAVFAAFAEAVQTGSFVRKPNDVLRRTARLWNEAAGRAPGWPQTRLAVPSFRAPGRTLPLEAYPPSFGQEVAAHLNWLAGTDMFADNPPPRPSRPLTVRLRRTNLLLAASALVESGRAPEQITGLANLVEPDAVKAIARVYLARKDNKPTVFLRGLVRALRMVAKHWLRVAPGQLEALRELHRRLGADPAGLTDKNRATLRGFDDPAMLGRLLRLPQTLLAEARARDAADRRSAIKAQLAAAVAILLAAPLRMKNLAGLAFERSLFQPARRKGPWIVALAPDETKAGEAMEYEIGGEAATVLAAYVETFRSRLPGAEGPWLFPAEGGGAKTQETLAQQITEVLARRVGVRMTPHQFRHLAAKLALQAAPGSYENVRQLLGHRNAKTTTRFYTGLQTRAAARVHDGVLERLRAELPLDRSPRRRLQR